MSGDTTMSTHADVLLQQQRQQQISQAFRNQDFGSGATTTPVTERQHAHAPSASTTTTTSSSSFPVYNDAQLAHQQQLRATHEQVTPVDTTSRGGNATLHRTSSTTATSGKDAMNLCAEFDSVAQQRNAGVNTRRAAATTVSQSLLVTQATHACDVTKDAELQLIMRASMLSREHKYRAYDPAARYHRYRRIVVDWMSEVGEECRLCNLTVHLAVRYLDRFLTHTTVEKNRLQLVALCCILIGRWCECSYDVHLRCSLQLARARKAHDSTIATSHHYSVKVRGAGGHDSLYRRVERLLKQRIQRGAHRRHGAVDSAAAELEPHVRDAHPRRAALYEWHRRIRRRRRARPAAAAVQARAGAQIREKVHGILLRTLLASRHVPAIPAVHHCREHNCRVATRLAHHARVERATDRTDDA
jgi:hypothetical protein